MPQTVNDVKSDPGVVIENPHHDGTGLASVRAQMYQFLAAVYLEPPTPKLLRQLADSEFLDGLGSLLGEPAVTELRKFADGYVPDRAAAALRQEYMDLFAVPTGRYVSPFEDVYGGGTSGGHEVSGPLLGGRAIAAIRAYRAAGAKMEATCAELPTHVGVELAFMSFLCEREAAAEDGLEDGEGLVAWREREASFLGQHLNLWFPQLSARIQALAAGPFYRGLALATEAFLRRDTAAVEAALGRPADLPAAGSTWI